MQTKAAWKAAPGASASKKAAPRLLLRAPAYAHTPHMQLGIGRERRPCDIRKRRRERKRRRGKRKRRRRRRRRRGSGRRRGRTEEEEIRGGEGGGRRGRRKEKKRGRRRRREKEEEEEEGEEGKKKVPTSRFELEEAGEEGEEEEEEEEEQTPQNTTKKQKYQHPGSNWRPIFFSPAAGLNERRTQLNTQTQPKPKPKPNRSRHAIGGWVDCQGGSPPFLRQCWFGNPPSRAFGVLIRVAPYGYALRGCTNAVKGLLVEELGEGREKVLECLLGYLEVVVTWQ